MLYASAILSSVQLRFLLAVLISPTQQLLVHVSPPFVCPKHFARIIIAYISLDTNNGSWQNANCKLMSYKTDMKMSIRSAVIGQNPMRSPWGFGEEDDCCRKLKIELAQQIMVLRQNGMSKVLVICDCGVGLYAGKIINGLRETDHNLILLCYTPHENVNLFHGISLNCGDGFHLSGRGAIFEFQGSPLL